MTVTPDKSALEKARERLEDECQRFKECYRFDPEHADVRLVLDALAEAEAVLYALAKAEAERPRRHELDHALSARYGWRVCRKCGVVMPGDGPTETVCSEQLPAIDTRDSAKDSQ